MSEDERGCRRGEARMTRRIPSRLRVSADFQMIRAFQSPLSRESRCVSFSSVSFSGESVSGASFSATLPVRDSAVWISAIS